MNIVITNSITPTFTAIGPLCQNSTAPVLPTSSTNTPAITGTWSPATINTAIAGTTIYTFTPAIGQCASATTMNIVVNVPIPAVRYTSVTAIPNTPLQLAARNIGTNYLWTPATGLSVSTISNPVFNYNQQTEYQIRFTAIGGCTVTDTLLVRMPVQVPPLGNADILVPKAWSPNGDGHNDKLIPFMVNIKELSYFRIFNRWGQLVYETKITGQGWDGFFNGKPPLIDTYQWIATGISNDGKIIKRSGNSVLIR